MSVMLARIRKTCSSVLLALDWILRMNVLPRRVSDMFAVRRKKRENSIYDCGGVARRKIIEPANDIMKPEITKVRMVFGCIYAHFLPI